MADDRNDEQRAADTNLREAIQRTAAAYSGDETAGWILTEYLVIYAKQGWDDDGDQCTAIGTAVDGDSAPLHKLLGLADYTATRLRARIASDDGLRA